MTGDLQLSLDIDRAIERDPTFAARATAWIVALDPDVTFTTDVLRRAVGDPAGHGDACGGVITRAQEAGLIRYSGRDRRSERAQARGRWIREWTRL